MKFVIDYWYIIVAFAVVVVAAGIAVVWFLGLPRGAQLRKVREWLLLAVTNAEMELGSKTGKLKLRMVYDAFLTKFPWLAPVISFDRFAKLVDDALDEMRDMLEKNEAVKALVDGKEDEQA